MVNYFIREFSTKWFNTIIKISPLCVNKLSNNTNVTMEIVLNNLDLCWNWDKISDNLNMDIKYMFKNIKDNKDDEQWKWCFYELGKNKHVTMKMIQENINCDWYWGTISSNPNLTIEMIRTNIDKNWNWYDVTCNKNIKLKDILNNPDFPWVWDNISQNPNITMKDILEHPEINWSWINISVFANITIKDVLENQDKKWCYETLGRNGNITMKDIFNNPNFNWCFSSISRNPNLKINDVLNNIDKKWSLYHISLNKNISFEDFLVIAIMLEQTRWCYNIYYNNHNLTIKSIAKNIDNYINKNEIIIDKTSYFISKNWIDDNLIKQITFKNYGIEHKDISVEREIFIDNSIKKILLIKILCCKNRCYKNC